MPELPLIQASPAQLVATQSAIRNKDDVEKYASIIKEISNFANSDVGKMLIQRVIPPSKTAVVGDPRPSPGDYKPMPAQNGADGVGFSPNFRPAGGNMPEQVHERVIVKEIPVPVPLYLSAEDQYTRFMGALGELSKHVGEEKSMKEAIEWATNKKDLIITMTQPLKINPPQ